MGSPHPQSQGLGGQREPSSRFEPAPSVPWTCHLDVKLTPLPQSFCLRPIPPSWVPFSFFSSHSILPTCLSPSLLHVPAPVTIYVCLSCCSLSPEARTRGWRPGTLLGKNTHAPHAHAPPATLHQQVGAGGGFAPRCRVHAQGCRLHPCFSAGPQALWRVPAAQRL